ncbi:traub family protein [Schizosaccharomyces cryophilus OY26]|uniref:Protein BFR2 n=1 Tax=Schizosaccharomyces cryophilus (strain OY26 / ATCC MYA-4695 / CBS 11777 / NBRC 106824 / NRRL Y48691) TaxID=653667 RepID=S9X8K1_SCHCR|nr:traub family protein [Schizosaccharomyces cryophilus OY26]EPY53467.1 traub family protein [Schizosaccharomyces cryophilus OY26]
MGKVFMKDELASMLNPAPEVEKDPEAIDAPFSDEEYSSDNQNNAAGREHYVDVGASKLRSKQAPALDPRFKGKKTTRKDLVDQTNESVSAEGSEDLEEESIDEDDSAISGEELSEGVSGDENEEDVSDQAPSENEGESESKSSSEDENDQVRALPDSDLSKLKKMLHGEQKLSDKIRSSAVQDMQKGLALQEQMRLYDRVLDTRIRLQKGFSQAHAMSTSKEGQEQDSKIQDGETASEVSSEDVKKSLMSFLQETMELRFDMMVDSGIEPRGLKRKAESEDVESISSAMNDLDNSLEEWKNNTLTKWHSRVQASQGITQSNKFKALNQNVVQQIDQTMLNKNDLIERSRFNRSENSRKDPDPELYDDTEFYQSLLKDFINSRLADSGRDTNVRWVATKQQKQKRENVDTKASKGRKLRYHVHEKLQNFMVPVEVTSWPEEHIDDLFNSLLGQRIDMSENPKDEEDAEKKQEEQELSLATNDGFSLFG